MRIGVNALYLLPGKVGGSEVYVRNLVKWLPEVSREEAVVFVNRESAGVFKEEPGKLKVVLCDVRAESRPRRILYEQFVLPRLAERHGLDALVSAGMTGPFVSKVPNFTMLYDLQHVNQPENFGRLYLPFLRAIIYLSAKRSRAVLTLSEKSRQDIIKNYHIPPDKVSVTYLASDPALFFRRPAEETESVRKKYGLPEKFVLYIASSLPHKNYERLLEAFDQAQSSEPGLTLVLIGARDYGHEAIRKKISALNMEDKVVFLGWLPFEDIPRVYSAAGLFVFPSLHEGFGIPVLEAMACGVPVVCSKIRPLDEVAGDAAFFVDPLDPADIARGILNVLRDKGLRERLINSGLRRAASFSWRKAAADTLSAVSRHLTTGRNARCGTLHG